MQREESFYESGNALVSKERKRIHSCDAWSAGIWARLRNGERAYSILRYHITKAMEDSLLGLNRNGGKDVFQIDSNLGFISAVANMLLDSSERKIVLLPALPFAWKSGSIRDFNHWLPGEGEIDWVKLMDKLDQVGYEGVFMYELNLDSNRTISRDHVITPEQIAQNANELICRAPLTKRGRVLV